MELYSAVVLGLIGSLHCAGMCGPLALALPPTGSTAAGYTAGRLAYNAGRVTTYALLGLVFGLAGKSLALAGLQRSISIILGGTLLVFLLSPRRLALSKPLLGLVGQLKGRMAGVLRRRTFVSLMTLGLLNGLLPCGLVYAACAGAASTGSVLHGAEYMIGFGLGTLPMMLGISLSGKLVPPRVRLKLSGAIPVAGIVLAALLILRGLSLGIPYLSPELATGAGCCHVARP